MEIFSVFYTVIVVVCACFAAGTFFALPMIWYLSGHISRKLDKVIRLLEEGVKEGK